MARKVAIALIVIGALLFIGEVVLIDLLKLDMGIFNTLFKHGSTIAIIIGVVATIPASRDSAKKKKDSGGK